MDGLVMENGTVTIESDVLLFTISSCGFDGLTVI